MKNERRQTSERGRINERGEEKAMSVCVDGEPSNMYPGSTPSPAPESYTDTHTHFEPSVTTPGQVEEPKGRSYIKRTWRVTK